MHAGSHQWAQERFGRLRRDAERYHGTVTNDFAAFLIGIGLAEVRKRAEAYIKEFTDAFDVKVTSPALRDLVRNFAITYAGGCLAVEAELLPIKQPQLRRSITACLIDSLNAIRPERDVEVEALGQLRQSFEAAAWQTKREAAKSEEDPTSFTVVINKTESAPFHAVTTVAFREWFQSQAHLRAALRWLHDEKLLILPDGAEPEMLNYGIQSVTKNVKLDGTSTRCIVLRNPLAAIEVALKSAR